MSKGITGNTVSYFPDKSIKQGYLTLFKEMVTELSDSRWLIWQLFRRNFRATYAQSVFGVAWALIIPLITVGTFIFLNNSGIFNIGDVTVPYPIFAVAGLAIWQLFAMGLTLSTGSLTGAGAMVTKVNFTKESLVISSVIQSSVTSLIQIIIVFILFAVYRITPPLTALLVPLTAVPLLALALGFGLILSLVNAVLRDIGSGISLLVTFLMLLTPILYAKPGTGIVALVSRYNPVYYLVSVPRDLLVSGTTAEVEGYLYSAIFSFAVLLLCWFIFHLTESRVTERI